MGLWGAVFWGKCTKFAAELLVPFLKNPCTSIGLQWRCSHPPCVYWRWKTLWAACLNLVRSMLKFCGLGFPAQLKRNCAHYIWFPCLLLLVQPLNAPKTLLLGDTRNCCVCNRSGGMGKKFFPSVCRNFRQCPSQRSEIDFPSVTYPHMCQAKLIQEGLCEQNVQIHFHTDEFSWKF